MKNKQFFEKMNELFILILNYHSKRCIFNNLTYFLKYLQLPLKNSIILLYMFACT
jgi:hypothetical protein